MSSAAAAFVLGCVLIVSPTFDEENDRLRTRNTQVREDARWLRNEAADVRAQSRITRVNSELARVVRRHSQLTVRRCNCSEPCSWSGRFPCPTEVRVVQVPASAPAAATTHRSSRFECH